MTLSDDRCCFGKPLRDHEGHCALGCDFNAAVMMQAMRDELAGVTIGQRIAFEEQMRGRALEP